MSYARFIESKIRKPKLFGVPADTAIDMNSNMFEWQGRTVDWALRRGRAAIFAECGLGKTLMQLEFARHVVEYTGLPVMLHCPIGVRSQTLQESRKFGVHRMVPVTICDSMSDVKPKSVCLVNYDKLHKFDASVFGGVILDESQILKNYTGTTKRKLCEVWSDTRFRLACTATPAPNDHMELGNHAEFLGVMPSNEMLSRWFINDTMKAGGYRLKGHAQRDFWQWVTTWAVCITKPSDIGGSDEGYDLPELIETTDVVSEDGCEPIDGWLFNNFELNTTNVHAQKRSTATARAERVAELVTPDEPWVIWCQSNYEADALRKAIPYALEVRGADSDKHKEETMRAFSDGVIKTLITKPKIAGMGMNWQHCSRMAFVGLSYSFEEYYQAVRRCWRFGQTNEVHAHIIESDGEAALREAITKKQAKFSQMRIGMAEAVQDLQLTDEMMRQSYEPAIEMEVPSWV